MKIALIGQSAFGSEVFKEIVAAGHTVVGVFTIPDVKGKEDVLAQTAAAAGVKVFKFPRWKALIKDGGKVIPEVLETYKEVGAELNVLAFVTQFIPMEVIDFPKHGSIVYHPSLLPVHRGASAINWTLMCGDKKGGFTIFWADDGLDTGPILLQKEVEIDPDDTLNGLYKRFLFPEGVKGMVEAVKLIHEGKAPRIEQPKEGKLEWNGQVASYDVIWKDKNLAKIDWTKPAQTIHNFIRGNDRVPGAWTTINGEMVTLYGSHFLGKVDVEGKKFQIEGTDKCAIQTNDSLVFEGSDGQKLSVNLVQVGTKTMPAQDFGKENNQGTELVLNDSEKQAVVHLQSIWKAILNMEEILDELDFFGAGAASMDVTRLVSNVKKLINLELNPEEVYLNTSFSDMKSFVVKKLRGEGAAEEVKIDTVNLDVNGMTVKIPHQLFIDGKFVDALDGKTYDTINPTTEESICKVSYGGKEDVNLAVKAAKQAFEPSSPWRKMNARDRGALMHRLADLMEQHKEELATIESLDSGAVYTLALKTHVGMSIDTFRYFAGWCDKIHGSTIPINNARPNFNLCFTKREPIGPCGIVIPWNYPLMMLAWKTAACIAAGNTVVIKPAQVTPLTALKWAELTVKAGFPKGVVNIIPGSGTIVGEAIAMHPDIRKLGFTGSTEIGKVIMKSAAISNLKKVSLELGGKSPLIIFDDCDMDKAVRSSMSAVFFNKGENCIAAGRLFVHEKIHDEFIKRIIEETKKMVIGDPLDPNTSHGPQNHKAHLDKLLEYINKGVKEGATLAYGGKRVERKGFFLEPTILTNAQDNTYIAKEESFGPIMIVSKFDGDIDKVLKRANDHEYGLSSGVFTKDINKALRVADGLEAGTCYINTYNKTDVASPFGGFKQSGFGKDLGEDALNEYLRVKSVTVEYSG